MLGVKTRQDIGIVGGGIAGLFCGYLLSRKGYRVTIFEEKSSLGGLCDTADLGDGIRVDRLYRHIFPHDSALLSLIKEAGIADEVVWKECPTAAVLDGVSFSLNSLGDAARLLRVSRSGKFASAFFVLQMLLGRGGEKLDKTSACDLVTAHCGTEAWEKIYKPPLRAKFGSGAENISGAWLWSKMRQRLRCRRSQRGEMLGAFKSSSGALVGRLAREIHERGGELRTDSRVEKILVRGAGGPGVSVRSKEYFFDSLIASIPTPEFLRLVPSSLAEKHPRLRKLAQIRHAHSLCLLLRLDKALSSAYMTFVGDEESPFSLIVEQTNLIASLRGRGAHIVYLGAYVLSEAELFGKKDEDLFKGHLSYLSRIFPHVSEKDVTAYRVGRFLYGQPWFETGYADLRPGFSLPADNTYLINASQLFPMERTVNNLLVLAQGLVKRYYP